MNLAGPEKARNISNAIYGKGPVKDEAFLEKKRVMGFEPTTFSLATRRSTN